VTLSNNKILIKNHQQFHPFPSDLGESVVYYAMLRKNIQKGEKKILKNSIFSIASAYYQKCRRLPDFLEYKGGLLWKFTCAKTTGSTA
ncbi:MAG: hypothetical protein OSJ69_22450, partial [Acetatifactor sp.]|nr:hypothetical protein [Acetatifactor sp.]